MSKVNDYPKEGLPFSYKKAFSRNIGWVTQTEQNVLKDVTVCIAGLGGVGFLHALTLVRFGFTQFKIADPDVFECVNFNRQFGATTHTIGRSKEQVCKSQILKINPNAEVELFGKLDVTNIERFISCKSIVIDGLDFFTLETRRLLFRVAQMRECPAVTAAPIGTGASCMCFWPAKRGLSFEDYFNFGEDPEDNLVRFLVGMSPAFLHRKLLVDPGAVDFKNRKVPSTVAGCEIAAGFVVATTLKIIREWVNREEVVECAPHCVQFDPFLGRSKITKRGPQHLLRWLTYKVVCKALKGK